MEHGACLELWTSDFASLEISFEMTVGPISKTVTVEAGAPLVNTESGTFGTVIDRFSDCRSLSTGALLDHSVWLRTSK